MWNHTLNTLIRVLIRKIPVGALEEFMYVTIHFSMASFSCAFTQNLAYWHSRIPST